MSVKLSKKTIDLDSNKVNNIDFNFPSLNRKDLSDLSNINNKNKKFKKLNTNRDWSLNLYNLDIEGSSPRKFGYFFNKEDFTNKNSDIEKSSPKNYNIKINKKSFNLTNDDIEFSKPQCVKNATTRHTNPLQPKYIMKSPEILPITPPKFIRNAMDVKDIKGSQPKKIGNDKNLFKEPTKKDIIKDSWPRKPYLRKSKYEYMDYRDVTNMYVKHRNTNPLRPIYNWKYVDNSKCFGPIDGNYPLVYSKYLYPSPFNLTNKDIEGSHSGSKNRYSKFHGTNYSYNTSDIIGAQENTVARGIITNRHINPLCPKYKYLGQSDIANFENNPYNTVFKSNYIDGKKIQDKKINFDINNNTFSNINTIKKGNLNSIEDKNDFPNNKENNSILEKNIKIIDNKNESNTFPKNNENQNSQFFNTLDQGTYNGNFFGTKKYNDLLNFNLTNQKLDKNNEQINENKFEKIKVPTQPINKNEINRRTLSTFSHDENNYEKLDKFINSRNINENQNSKNNKASNSNIE